MLEEIEQLSKYMDMLESKQHYHQSQIDRLEIELNKTQIAIDNIRKKQSTMTDFKTAKELNEERNSNIG